MIYLTAKYRGCYVTKVYSIKPHAVGIKQLLYFVFAQWTLPGKDIEAGGKWVPLCKQYFESNFRDGK